MQLDVVGLVYGFPYSMFLISFIHLTLLGMRVLYNTWVYNSSCEGIGFILHISMLVNKSSCHIVDFRAKVGSLVR